MRDYYIYSYNLNTIPYEPDILAEKRPHADTPTEALDDILAVRQLAVSRPERKGGVEKYGNMCYSKSKGVSLIRLKNNRNVKVWQQDFKQVNEPSYPYVDIIFDNRPGHNILAIEKNNAFSKRKGDRNATMHVRDILVDSINRLLEPYGLKMVATPVTKECELWAMVSHHILKDKARVRSIEISFLSNDEARQREGALRMTQEVLETFQGDGAQLHIDYHDGGYEEMNRISGNLRAIELFAGNNVYDLCVNFDDMSVMKTGETLWAHFQITENIISDFIDGQSVFNENGETTFSLNNTLDLINDKIKNFEQA